MSDSETPRPVMNYIISGISNERFLMEFVGNELGLRQLADMLLHAANGKGEVCMTQDKIVIMVRRTDVPAQGTPPAMPVTGTLN